jgi:hypothetical protein
MNVKYVTFTGADDSTNIDDMIALSNDFPFVEWGILFSKTKEGQPRYPTNKWIRQLEQTPIKISAHLCGWYTIYDGYQFFLERYSYLGWNRIQLNLGQEDLFRLLKDLNHTAQSIAVQCLTERTNKIPIILGGNYNILQLNAQYFLDYDLMPLYDASGGKGQTNNFWPQPFAPTIIYPNGKAVIVSNLMLDKLLQGFAGGFGPDNIRQNLNSIEKNTYINDIWIDMETNIRTNEKLDLNKCRQVAQIVEQYNSSRLFTMVSR